MLDNRHARRLKEALTRCGFNPTPDLIHEILMTNEAARYVRLSKPTLERFRIQGEGPCYCKLGGAVRYRKTDLDAWLESRRVRSTSERGAK